MSESKQPPIPEPPEKEWQWLDPTESPFRLVGFAWFAQDRVYRRLPLKPRWPLPAGVNSLANCTAGGQIQFRTASPRVAVKVELAGPSGMYHMPATGQSGFDCYLGPPKKTLYRSTAKFGPAEKKYECALYDFPETDPLNVTLNFPLYQGVRSVEVGVEPGASVEAPPPYDDPRPIIVYGTSITQGGCAARPGLCYTNILSRRLNRPFINLGFSGSGRGEPEVARVVAEIPDPAAFVLDYEANAGSNNILQNTLEPFIAILREAHPETPILVVSRTRTSGEMFSQAALEGTRARREFQRETVKRLRAEGDDRVFFHDGGELMGEDFHECTVDGGHPHSMGFWLMAKGLAPVMERVLADG